MASKLKVNWRSRCDQVRQEVSKLEDNLLPVLKESTVVVTGANTGIGKKTAEELAYIGGTVVLACRNLEKANKAIQDIKSSGVEKHGVKAQDLKLVVMQLDLSDLSSVKSFVETLVHKLSEGSLPKLRVLVYNAALIANKFELSKQGFEMTFAVSHLGHFFLTKQLLETKNLKDIVQDQKLRIVNVSSGSHYGPLLTKNITDEAEVKSKVFGILEENEKPPRTTFYRNLSTYGQAKLCNVLFGISLSKLNEEEKVDGIEITSCSLHPGAMINTEITRGNAFLRGFSNYVLSWFTKSLDQGSSTTYICSILPDKDITGNYFTDCVPKQPSKITQGHIGKQARDLLWNLSEEYSRKFLNA